MLRSSFEPHLLEERLYVRSIPRPWERLELRYRVKYWIWSLSFEQCGGSEPSGLEELVCWR